MCLSVWLYKVLEIVRAERQRQKSNAPPPTPHDLSIHKDVSTVAEADQTAERAIRVLKNDSDEEVFMGKTQRHHFWL